MCKRCGEIVPADDVFECIECEKECCSICEPGGPGEPCSKCVEKMDDPDDADEDFEKEIRPEDDDTVLPSMEDDDGALGLEADDVPFVHHEED